MKRILFAIPHPDDEIVGTCTLIKNFVEEKKIITIVFLTNGVISRQQNWFWKRSMYQHFVEIRKNEMLKSIELLGVKQYFYQNIPTRSLKVNIEETYKLISKIIKKNKIDTVFCPAYEGGHPDHDITNFICSRLDGQCNLFEFPEYNFYNGKINSNTFCQSYGKDKTIFLNSSEKKFKRKCLNIYKSEKNNLNYINLNKECFRPMIKYDYSTPPHKGILFYRRFSLFSWHPRVDSSTPLEINNCIKSSEIY